MFMNELYRIQIEGMVQGVGFRFHARRQAQSLGLSGWVKNQTDGSVLILAEGDPEYLEQFVGWCHEGPRSARVHHVTVQKEEPQGFEGFDVKY
jgi:acylphosphatase